MLIRKILFLSLSMGLAACDELPNATKLDLDPVGRQIDLSMEIPGDWIRICVIGPYSTNKHAEEILGVAVNIQQKSGISMLDSIALLVAMQGDMVVGLFEVPRGRIDFTKLAGNCYRRDDSKFAVPGEGHPYATHT